MLYKPDDKVIITKDGNEASGKGNGHSFNVGEVVQIVRVFRDCYAAIGSAGEMCINDDCCESVAPSKKVAYVRKRVVAPGQSRASVVTLMEDGNHSCTCRSFKSGNPKCAHISEAMRQDGDYSVPIPMPPYTTITVVEPEEEELTGLEKLSANAKWRMK